jgi:hypothetical protein
MPPTKAAGGRSYARTGNGSRTIAMKIDRTKTRIVITVF